MWRDGKQLNVFNRGIEWAARRLCFSQRSGSHTVIVRSQSWTSCSTSVDSLLARPQQRSASTRFFSSWLIVANPSHFRAEKWNWKSFSVSNDRHRSVQFTRETAESSEFDNHHNSRREIALNKLEENRGQFDEALLSGTGISFAKPRFGKNESIWIA